VESHCWYIIESFNHICLPNKNLDGDYLTDFPSTLIQNRQFVKIPIITGANSDEGSSFSSHSVKTDAEIATWLKTWRSYNLSTTSINRLTSLYETYDYPPYLVDSKVHFPNTTAKWRKSGAIGGDIVMIAGRRKVARVWSSAKQNVFSMRFDTPAWNAKPSDGSKHSAEHPFTFQNITGLLGPMPEFKKHQDLSKAIGKAYINFVNGFDPNQPVGKESADPKLPPWPRYSDQAVNMVLNANNTHVERDDWRREGIDFINTIWRELLA
jgi:carboxylesterase type B